MHRRTFMKLAASFPIGTSLGSLGQIAPVLPEPFIGAVPAVTKGATRHNSSSFGLRGIKGWAWTAQQYADVVPLMARAQMNFLMNDYASFWDFSDGGPWGRNRRTNFWYKPLPEETKHAYSSIIASCKKNAIEFCFSLNPNLHSDRPFDYSSSADLDALCTHYEWAQSLGVRWFNVSFDDITDRIDAGGQCRLLNEMLGRLRSRDSQCELVFCPTWYAGTGAPPSAGEKEVMESHATLGWGDTPGIRYTKQIAADLSKDIYLYWTGPAVCSIEITRQQAISYRALSGHRIIIWDNYPVNDLQPSIHLGPLVGRDPALPEIVAGFITNMMGQASNAANIPMLTAADFMRSPTRYDPQRSLSNAIEHLASNSRQRRCLNLLVELYPGRLSDRSDRVGWDSFRERVERLSTDGSAESISKLLDEAQEADKLLREEFSSPNLWGAQVLESDIAFARQALARMAHN